ncbi:MAG: glycosyltransferase family 2 protein [Paludibacter sp.]|nr:glycosyltransferase family 2 protein [Paludibacter sp.]
MQEIKFSIIVPVYNTPEVLLRRCLDSVVNQDYKHFEIVLVNDGSTDDSLCVLKEYQVSYNNIKIIDKKNEGISAARNTGIDASTGDYTLFVDSDDYLLRNTVLTELSKILEKDDCDCIYFPGANAGENSDGTVWYVENHYDEKIYNNAWECLEKYCLGEKVLVFGSVYAQCYKSRTIKENNLKFNTNVSYGEDRLFVIQFFACAGKTYVYSKPCYCYFTRKDSLMTQSDKEIKKMKDAFVVVELLYNTIRYNTTAYNRYVNGLYRKAISDSYKNSLKVRPKKIILITTAIKTRSIKVIIKSFLLAFLPKLYLKIFNSETK